MRYHKLGQKEVLALISLASERDNLLTCTQLAEYIKDSPENMWKRLNHRLLSKGLVQKLGDKYKITSLGLNTVVAMMMFGAGIKPSKIMNYPMGSLQKRLLLALVLVKRANVPTLREKLSSYGMRRRSYNTYRDALMGLVHRGLATRFKVKYRKVLYEITERGLEVAREIAREAYKEEKGNV